MGVRGGFGDGEGGGVTGGLQVVAVQTIAYAANPFGLSLSKASPSSGGRARVGLDRLGPNGLAALMSIPFFMAA